MNSDNDELARKAQISKMATLGEMAAGISHEINNPLAIIKGKVALILRELTKPDPDRGRIQEHALALEKTVNRIAKIIHSLRTFSRDGSRDDFQIIPVKHIIDDTLTLCMNRFTNYKVNLRIPEVSPQLIIQCRAVPITQVLLNLLSNSFDAISNLQEKWVELQVNELPNEIELSVTDSGNGIPLEVQAKMFDPFYTTKEIGSGTGLGLSICAGIVKDHSGKIYVDNESTHTRIVVVLPKKQVSKERKLT